MKKKKRKRSFTGRDLPVNCPFCGLGLAYSENPLGIIHMLPMCWVFDRLEPHEFMAAVNDHFAKEDGTEAELAAERKRYDQEHNQ